MNTKNHLIICLTTMRLCNIAKKQLSTAKRLLITALLLLPLLTFAQRIAINEDNSDNCGRSFSTALNHRSIIYWETNDFSYGIDQWFHTSPMMLDNSTGLDNSLQDGAFFWR